MCNTCIYIYIYIIIYYYIYYIYIINELFDSFLQKYQKRLEEMEGSRFIFDSVDLLHYYLQKISLKTCGSYIDSPKWLKNKKQQ